MNKLMLSATATLALLGLTAPGSANILISKNSAAKLPPPPRPAALRQIKIPGGGPNIVLIGPGGCSSDGSYSFIGGGYGDYAGYGSGVLDGAYNEACDEFTGISGGNDNTVGGDGTSYASEITGGYSNAIEGGYSFIGAGNNNTVAKVGSGYNYTSYASAIVAGINNVVASYGSFVGAGYGNSVYGNQYSYIGAGYDNTVDGNYSTIGAGYDNVIDSDYDTIAGGIENTITGGATTYATIAGGFLNTATGEQASIGGGYGNKALARDATIPGGTGNTVTGTFAFAAGSRANAATQGSFVWSDSSTTGTLTSTVANEFLARAVGGFYLYSSDGGTGVKLAPGSGAWSNLSDRNAKHDIQEVNDEQVLTKLAAMPVSTWTYNSEGSVRHLGPMAQDFRAAFNLGEDDTSISTIDEEGVALAAIKALKAENDAKQAQISDLTAKYDNLAKRLEAIENRQN